MKIVLLSDIHLLWKNPVARIDNLPDIQFPKLEYVLDWAEKHNAIILQAGDFFHRPRNWTLLAKVIFYLNNYQVPIYCVYGQHDTYFYSETTREATSLGILEKAEYVNILGKEGINIDISKNGWVRLYGVSWGQEVPAPIIQKDWLNILVIHAPISTEPLFPDHKYTSAKSFFKKHSSYDLILCGDIHRKFELLDPTLKNNRWLINTGPMLRLTAEKYSFEHKPSFAVYDTDNRGIEWITIPHKPAEESLSANHIENKIETEEILNDFIESIKEGYGVSGVDLKENIKTYIKENEIPKDVQEILAEVMQDE